MSSSSGSFGLWGPGSGDLWLDAYLSDFLTRAREELILTCPGIVSPFVKELPKPVWDGRERARAYMPETKQMRLF